ncbi:hypothetical protein [Pusillimonas caeni]|uniref:hypothetical protein n=1 Tax=Pusillimonas caeni TaxID=1348472 RepID=UPI001FD762B4|nr:hypothetical protein [Pusillimonas caeni]
MTLHRSSFKKVWGAPIALAVLTCAGLLSALLGAETWHWVSWLCLAIPLATGLGYWLRPRKRA